MRSAKSFPFDCSSLAHLVQEEPGKVIRPIQTPLAGPARLSSWDCQWGGVVQGDGEEALEGFTRGSGREERLGVEGCNGGRRGGCMVLSLRSANLDSGRNFLWFIQRELLHLYKLEPARMQALSPHTHTHTRKSARMSTPSVQRGAGKLNSLITRSDNQCSDAQIKSYKKHT